jgi:DNA-binding XRE family transcriptional regulator
MPDTDLVLDLFGVPEGAEADAPEISDELPVAPVRLDLRTYRRVIRAMSQRQLAAASGVTRPTIISAERGDRVVTLVTRVKLAAALGVDVAAIAWPERVAKSEEQ